MKTIFYTSQKWISALIKNGHTPIIDNNNKLDIFVKDSGDCNGPGCSTCKMSYCMHCFTTDQIKPCKRNK
jgi:hypothetical protein